ncbi:MAG: serine/threonine-protein kinase, partial [Acidobacteria bacterium]|nr:serine/threonine-protein kinase [Acidobacteriota bacterium]
MEAPLDRPLAPGDLVGRYRIEAFVAEGGMGRVYRAWDLMLDRAVALKTIRGDLAGDRQVMNRFHREAQLLAKLDHPGICHVYDWLDHHGTLVMAMEWVEGTPLSTLLEGGPLPIQQAARLLREVALALASAHAKGVIHRDLKPSNICLTEGGSAKLLDFGLATVQGEALALETRTGWLGASGEASTMPCTAQENRLTQSGAILGTRGYMAPELLMGEPASAAADLYALGVVASMLLTGSKDPSGPGGGLPWVRQSLERRSPSGHHPSGPIPTLPNALWHLVDDLLSLSPPARPSAQAVVQTLDRMLAPRSPVWWSSATAILTLALVALGLWAYGRGAIPEFSRTRHARLVVVPVLNHTGSASLRTAVEITTTELLEYVLRAFPQVEVVRDGYSQANGAEIRPRLDDPGEGAEQDFIRRLVARTGADLVLMGEVALEPGSERPLLRVRVLNPNGGLRVSRETSSSGPEYEPNRAVPAVLRQLDRTFSPLGRPGDFPPMPSQGTLEAYARGLEPFQRGEVASALPHLEKAALEAHQFAPAILRYASALRRSSDSRAMSTLMWAQSVARESGDRYSQTRAILEQAYHVYPDAAQEPLLQKALALARTSGDKDLQALLLNELGVYSSGKGNRMEAKQQLRAA